MVPEARKKNLPVVRKRAMLQTGLVQSLERDASQVSDSISDTALPPHVLDVLSMTSSADAVKAETAQAQYRELAGILFPWGAHDWISTSGPSPVAFVEDGVLVFDPSHIDVRRVDDERACMRSPRVRRGARDGGRTPAGGPSGADVEQAHVPGVRVHPGQISVGVLLFSTLPCRVVEVVVCRPRAFGMGGVVRAVMAVTSSKIQKRTRLV